VAFPLSPLLNLKDLHSSSTFGVACSTLIHPATHQRPAPRLNPSPTNKIQEEWLAREATASLAYPLPTKGNR